MQSQFKRFLGKYDCDATLSLHAAGRVLPARCRSLGPSGFEALVSHRLDIGQLVYVEFWLTNVARAVTLCARVVSCDGFFYQFEVVADEQYRLLFSEVLREALYPPQDPSQRAQSA